MRAFAVERDGTRVSELLERIGELTGQAGSVMERYAGRIVEAIASRDEFDLTAGGAVSLAELIERANSRGADGYVQMCWQDIAIRDGCTRPAGLGCRCGVLSYGA